MTDTTPSTDAPLLPPIRLPRYTLIMGSQAFRDGLALRLAERDDYLSIEDLDEPLRIATAELFYGGFSPDLDLRSKEAGEKLLPGSKRTILRQWVGVLTAQINAAFPFGRASLFFETENAGPHLSSRLVFRDALASDARAFEEKYGHLHCCLVEEEKDIDVAIAKLTGIWGLDQ